MNLLQTNKSDKSDTQLRQLFKSTIRASYFNHMEMNKFTNKSKIQLQQLAKQQQIDQNTFKINRSYKLPENQFFVIKRQGYVSDQNKGGFFGCFGRRQYQAMLKNSVFQVFQGDKLRYYFDFKVINAKTEDKGQFFEVKLQDCNKNFSFYPIKSSSSQWNSALSQSISNSQGRHIQNAQINKIPEFYKKPYVSYKDFEQRANTGDIIFFRSQHSAARLQQVFLNSQYDHVAIVLRNKKNQLFLYESSSFEGVGLTQWKAMIKYQWYKSTEKIAWRRLNCRLQSSHYDIIEKFIAKTLGKGFDISLDKIFTFQSSIQRNHEQQQKKTYFCSQLVARLYKQLGFLDEKTASTQYYPVTFSDSGNIKLIDPKAKLEREYLIAF